MKRITIGIFIVLLCCISATSQTLVAEFKAQKKSTGIYPLVYNDSIFCSFAKDGGYEDIWVQTDGTIKESGINRPIFAITGSSNQTRYHSLRKINNSLLLHTLSKSAKGSEVDSSFLDISNSMWLASYVDGNLFLILFNKEQNEIEWHEVDGVNIVVSKKYKVPFNLAFYLKRTSQLEFFNEAGLTDTFKGSAKIKLFRYGKDLYLVLDQPYKSISEKGITDVVRFSLSNEEPNHHQFPTNATVNFTSFLIDNKLFRAFTTSKKFVIRVYDLITGEVLKETEIIRGQFNPMVFTRHGKKNEVYNNESLTTTMKLSQICEPSLALVKDGQSYGILWGTFYDENQVVGPSMLNPAGVITAIAFNAVLQSIEKPGISRYIYYACSSKDLTFQPSDAASSAIAVRKSIDTYELELERDDTKIHFKKYVAYEEGVIAVYYLRKADVIRLVRFD